MITQEVFQAYEKVRESGVTNMFDVKRVIEFSGLARIEILEIMRNYEELADKYK